MSARTLRPSRRRMLQAAMSIGGAALLSPALESTAQQNPKATLKKRSKEAVGYRDEPYEGRSCAKCVLYSGHGECVLVEGEVSPNGWCLQWTPATMGRLREYSTA
jgi:high potential iron-sulfur protein